MTTVVRDYQAVHEAAADHVEQLIPYMPRHGFTADRLRRAVERLRAVAENPETVAPNDWPEPPTGDACFGGSPWRFETKVREIAYEAIHGHPRR